MSSVKQVNSEQATTRVKPSTDEQAYDALDGKSHLVDIYYLMKGGESFTKKELANHPRVDKHKNTVTNYLNEMEDRGVVTYTFTDEEEGRNKKVWYLSEVYSDYTSERIIEERTVVEEKEVSPYDSIDDFLFEEYRWMVIGCCYMLAFGAFLLTYKYVFYDFYPTPIGSLPEMVMAGGLACILTLSAVALNEVKDEW